MLIPVFNPETDDLEKSYLTDPYSVGVMAIKVKNSDRFSTSTRIQIGESGLENTEVVTLSAVGSDKQSLTIGTTLFAHTADDPVYILRFDQVEFYRSTDSGNTYSSISTQALDVDNADLQTFYDDSTGLSSYYYKFRFSNSLTGLVSEYSDVIKGSGWDRNQVGYLIDSILREVGDPQEQHLSRTELIGYFNDVNDELTSQVSRPYEFLHTRAAFTRTAAQAYLDYPTDSSGNLTMWKFDHMDYNFTDSTTTPATDDTSEIVVMPLREFRNNYTDNTIDSTTESDNKPHRMALDEAMNRFRFSHPAKTTQANVFYLYYWKFFTALDSEADVVETPTSLIYKLYCKAQYWDKRALADSKLAPKGDRYYQRYLSEKLRYKALDRRDKGTPRQFRPRNTTFDKFVR